MYQNRKGIQFSIKDTWSLDMTLSPIILSALKKFKEVITDSKRSSWVGVPSLVMVEINPNTFEYTEEELEKGSKLWLEILDKMLYAFDLKGEPKITDYNFSFKHESEKLDDGSFSYHIETNNKQEYERYKKDEEDHHKKVEEGHILFGKFYKCLWW